MSSQSHKVALGGGGGSGPGTSALNKNRNGEIELTGRFADQMKRLFCNPDYSDVTFVVENSRLPAHRVIMAARSDYFRAMLYGGLAESQQPEVTLDVPLVAFRALLRYIYSGRLSLTPMKEDSILDTLGLAHQFGFTELEFAISEYLVQILSVQNCCAVLDAARLYSLETLVTVCHTFIDRNAKDLLTHASFLALSKDSLCDILARDSFFAPEVMIFVAVREWCRKNNDEADIQNVVKHVRLPLMKLEHLLTEVRSSGIIESDRLLDAINEKTTSKQLPYRGALWPEENIATVKFDSKTIQGDLRSSLLDGDSVSYDSERGFTCHDIPDVLHAGGSSASSNSGAGGSTNTATTTSSDRGIVVELGTISIINHIKLLLWDRDSRSYSYYVEVCVSPPSWDCVVDYQPYLCRSWQHLYFAPRAVKYIRIVGTHNTSNKVFHAVSLEAMFTATVPALKQDVIVPVQNVATVEMSASVIEGVSRSRNVLLNGDVKNYDWDSGYTCHQLGSGVILIQLGQPYVISSMRMLLWDLDDRTYSFYIETSINQRNWEMVVDNRKENQRSWQQFYFKARPVVFIKIVGTNNTANEIFHCVHFECPAQDEESKKQLAAELQQSCTAVSVAPETAQRNRRPMTLAEVLRFQAAGGEEQDVDQQHRSVDEIAAAAAAVGELVVGEGELAANLRARNLNNDYINWPPDDGYGFLF